MGNDRLIDKALEIIASVRGKHLGMEERKKLAVELAAFMLNEARLLLTKKEKKHLRQLAGMVNDPAGKVFTMRVCDECFRSRDNARVADQMAFAMKSYGIPKFVPFFKKFQMKIFQNAGRGLHPFFVPLVKQMLRSETAMVIIPGERAKLTQHILERKAGGVRTNLNHLGEAILGEEEAERRLQTYLEDLSRPEIEYISVKISTIYSQINLLAWEETLAGLAERLRLLYRAAMESNPSKFINLDMEEYRDLPITVELFKRVLSEPEFLLYPAGIVLQSYLPDSFQVQKELTEWAMKRVESGGAPIKVRIVKGANLAMEQVEASLEGWPQAPYTSKGDVDANYKRMVAYGMEPSRAKAVKLGVASHNLFDIAYAMLLRSENKVEKDVCFEMLEGMADHQRRVVQKLSGDILLYCPSATEGEFVNAVAYLVRRLDENTAPNNFLRHSFDLAPGTREWEKQAALFQEACDRIDSVNFLPRRFQDRNSPPAIVRGCSPFENEPNTDWTLPSNRKWAEALVCSGQKMETEKIPLVIGGEEFFEGTSAREGVDPSRPDHPFYRYALADEKLAEKAVEEAVEAAKEWSQTSVAERIEMMRSIAQGLREGRGRLIRAMVADGGKTVSQADIEVSEAIDFAEYYLRNSEELNSLKDIEWRPKGVVMVTPPWNFPCAIPFGGLAAALLAGNALLFKPAPETVLVGWEIANICWAAGVSKKLLQFISCDDSSVGSRLVKDPRINFIVLTGATATAELFLKMRPGLDLSAETGGKNAIIISRLSDRDLAIKDIIESAFGHAGQKCSACSLAILEREVYEDEHFRQQLRDAVKSLAVGSAWNLKTKINPLINVPGPVLMQGLTLLEKGEEWLLEPKQDRDNPRLWSPGIKLGITPASFTYKNELFGPVLGVMCADDIKHAVELANGTPYGLTSGIHSLDIREQLYWMAHIKAGNLYINRGITGAIVQRQPFGGCKASSFGQGAKAGGPNYLMQLMHPQQKNLPKEREPVSEKVALLSKELEKTQFSAAQLERWNAAIGSYAFYWNHYFSKEHDPTLIKGQDNIFRYVPREHLVLRMQSGDDLLDVLLAIAAAATCRSKMEISAGKSELAKLKKIAGLPKLEGISFAPETEDDFIDRVHHGAIRRVRFLSDPTKEMLEALADRAVNIVRAPVMANGRIELLNYLREVSISHNYHRYGNLGLREKEKRKPLPSSPAYREKGGCSAGFCPCDLEDKKEVE